MENHRQTFVVFLALLLLSPLAFAKNDPAPFQFTRVFAGTDPTRSLKMTFDDGLWFGHDVRRSHTDEYRIQFFDGSRLLRPLDVKYAFDCFHAVNASSLFASGLMNQIRYVHRVDRTDVALEDQRWTVYADADDVDERPPYNEDRQRSSRNFPDEGKQTMAIISAMSGTPEDFFFLDTTKHTIRHFADFPSEYSGTLGMRYGDRKISRAGVPLELAYTGDQKLFLIEESSGWEYEKHLPSAPAGTSRLVEYGLHSKERVLYWTHPGRITSLTVANYPTHVAFLETLNQKVHFLSGLAKEELPAHSEAFVPAPVNLVAFGKCFAILSENRHAYVFSPGGQTTSVADIDFGLSTFVKPFDKPVRLETDLKNNRLYLGTISPPGLGPGHSLPSVVYAQATDPKIFNVCRR